MRDMIQVVAVPYAYPVDYMTLQNQDFGTVKGFSAAYDLRRTGNVSLTANYTLQFADGTGSGSYSAFSLVNTGMPNLRTLIPLDYDQRHAITTTVNYSFDQVKIIMGQYYLVSKSLQMQELISLLQQVLEHHLVSKVILLKKLLQELMIVLY